MAKSGVPPEAHVWRFFRVGGFDQVRLDSGRDVAALDTLDQKLWVALACPTRGIEFDARTLELIDADRDGRIRAPEILEAVRWMVGLLKDPDELTGGRDTLPLSAIDERKAEGLDILASARTILRLLGNEGAPEISIQDTLDVERFFDKTAFNGDGVIPVEAAEDEDTRRALQDIIDCIGPVSGRSGQPGISHATADAFFAEADSYAAWRREAEERPEAILPLGEDTASAAQTVDELAAKLDDFYTRCRLAAFDATAEAALNPLAAAYEALASETISAARPDIAALPVAHVAAGATLPLDRAINPAWQAAIDRLRDQVVQPLLGAQTSLAEAQWTDVKAKLDAYRSWAARKPVCAAEKLGVERVRDLTTSDTRRRIAALIARDEALAPEMNAISRVEKLLRLRRDLRVLVNNIVSFRDFYTRAGKAIFQAGTLYLDGRSCDLCVKVEDETKHSQLATLGRIYLAYCLCTRDGGAERMTIAAAFTAGSSDNLMVGRNGVFYDRKGRDWDATIVKLIEHPISIREAFWMPYRQLGRFIGEQLHRLAAARAAGSQMQLAGGVQQAAGAERAREQAFDAARFAGIFAAVGLALAGIGTAIASVVTGFMRLAWWQMPLAILGIVLLISGPFMFIAFLKLRKRNLGPILDASGWAVNTRMRINIPFGTALTALAQLPEGAERSMSDPYAEKRRPWRLYLALFVFVAAAAILWTVGLIPQWIGLLRR